MLAALVDEAGLAFAGAVEVELEAPDDAVSEPLEALDVLAAAWAVSLLLWAPRESLR